ncbi:unnamed protein product, partial [marine sediment metagenome]
MVTTIQISEEIRKKLFQVINQLEKVRKRRVTYNEAIKFLLKEKRDDVSPEQTQALEDLENTIGKSIPPVKEIEWDTFGVKIEGYNVVGLGLYKQGLVSLPESIGDLTSLKSLWLQYNQLSTLPESIGNLSSLKKLSLRSNQLLTFPKVILNLPSLNDLDLNFNKLVTLPESIGNLTSLKILYLHKNQLSTLPESIG